jgi:hypothetical protein
MEHVKMTKEQRNQWIFAAVVAILITALCVMSGLSKGAKL